MTLILWKLTRSWHPSKQAPSRNSPTKLFYRHHQSRKHNRNSTFGFVNSYSTELCPAASIFQIFLSAFNKALYFVSLAHIKASQSHLASWTPQHGLGWMSNGIGMINLKLFGLTLCSRKYKWITECRSIRVLMTVNLPHSIGNFLYSTFTRHSRARAKRQLEVGTIHQMCSSSKSILGVTCIDSGAAKAK
jgi:hypothetical protein